MENKPHAESPNGLPAALAWNMLFTDLDKNHDGRLSQTEIVARLNAARKNEEWEFLDKVHELLGIPTRVRQEDGTRDVFEAIFQDIDLDGDKEISIDEFRTYMATKRSKTGGNSGASLVCRASFLATCEVYRSSLALPRPRVLRRTWKSDSGFACWRVGVPGA